MQTTVGLIQAFVLKPKLGKEKHGRNGLEVLFHSKALPFLFWTIQWLIASAMKAETRV